MGSTMIGTDSPNTAKSWSRRIYQEALRESYFGMFIGEDKTGRIRENDAGSLVCLKTELTKEPGDTVTMHLRAQLQGAGIVGDDTLEGNEEGMVFRNDSMTIDDQAHAVRFRRRMTQQRVPFNLREQARDGLRDWWSETKDQAMISILAGDTLQTEERYQGNNTLTAPSYHLVANSGANSTETNVGGDDTAVVTLQRLSAMRRYAQQTLRMRPVKTPKGPRYVVFLHDEHEMSLRVQNASGAWGHIQAAAMAGGKYDDNPLITGAVGEWDNMLFLRTDRLPAGINAAGTARVTNTRRLVLCGAQALCLAYGKDDDTNNMTYNEEYHDYKRELAIAMSSMWGLKKARYLDEAGANAVDHGVVVGTFYTNEIQSYI